VLFIQSTFFLLLIVGIIFLFLNYKIGLAVFILTVIFGAISTLIINSRIQKSNILKKKVCNQMIKGGIKKGKDLNRTHFGTITLLMMASTFNFLEEVDLLIKNGADVNIQDNKYGGTALMAAAENNFIEIVKLLVKAGAKINATQNKGGTALMGAVKCNSYEVVEFLIENGADVNATDNMGWTAKNYANNSKMRELIENHAK